VVVFRSGNPDFFLAHVELRPRSGRLFHRSSSTADKIDHWRTLAVPEFPATDPRNAFNAYELFYNMTQLPMTTIALVDGRARGAGNEFLLSCDMRFATSRNTLLGQPEVGLGLVTGAGASQYLPRLIGRGRAMEYLLSGRDVTGSEAERIGWINQAFETATEMEEHAGDLARRIALFPHSTLVAIRETINRASRPSFAEINAEAQAYFKSASTLKAQRLVERTLELTNDETKGSFEMNVGRMLPELYDGRV
jgi:enoyl-CoA hydratase/carnithine racemase